MTFSRVVLSTVLGLSMSFAANADTPNFVTIPPVVNGQANPSYGGTGCPSGSARAVVSPDRQSFTMIFDRYVVNANGPNGADRKNCQILVNFDFPQGWSYSIFRMDYRGFYDLSPGGSGYQQALYYFQGNLRQGRLQTNFFGPSSGNFTISDQLGISDLVWSPCGERRALNVNTSMLARVQNNPSGYSYLTTDSADGSVQTTFALRWQRCSATGVESSTEDEVPPSFDVRASTAE